MTTNSTIALLAIHNTTSRGQLNNDSTQVTITELYQSYTCPSSISHSVSSATRAKYLYRLVTWSHVAGWRGLTSTMACRPGKSSTYRTHPGQQTTTLDMSDYAVAIQGHRLCPQGRQCTRTWQLCTSSFMHHVTFSRNGPYGVAWPAWSAASRQLRAWPGCSLMSMNASLLSVVCR